MTAAPGAAIGAAALVAALGATAGSRTGGSFEPSSPPLRSGEGGFVDGQLHVVGRRDG